MISVAENRVVRDLEARKRELTSMRTSLENDINEASSFARIVPAAERRLGMHVATELEVRNLPQGARDSVASDSVKTDTLSHNAGQTGVVASNASPRRTP